MKNDIKKELLHAYSSFFVEKFHKVSVERMENIENMKHCFRNPKSLESEIQVWFT